MAQRARKDVLLLICLSSCLIGIITSACGVGGVLLIPVLMFFAGLDTHQAMGTALFSYFFAGIAATYIYQRYGSIVWEITLPVLAGSFISSYAGAAAGSLIASRHLDMLLAGIIIFSTLYSLYPPERTTPARRPGSRGSRALLFGIGLFTGFLCAMTGAGGGILSIPVMLLFGYAVLPSIATSQVLQSVVSLSGSAGNFTNGFIVFPLAWWVTIFELAGVLLGVRVAHALPVSALKKSITCLCMTIGFFIGVRAVL